LSEMGALTVHARRVVVVSEMERAGLEPATPSLQSQVGVIPGRAALTRNDRD